MIEIERRHWLVAPPVGFDLGSMNEWCLEQFADEASGGNGLIRDVSERGRPLEAVAEELLALLKTHCPEKQCPLGGNSVHCDREVRCGEVPRVQSESG